MDTSATLLEQVVVDKQGVSEVVVLDHGQPRVRLSRGQPTGAEMAAWDTPPFAEGQEGEAEDVLVWEVEGGKSRSVEFAFERVEGEED